MPRAPDDRINKARELYQQGHKLINISKELDLPEGTVRRWKSTYKWDSERSNKQSERSDKKNKVVRIKERKEKAVKDEVNQVIDNPDLTDKQRLFCLYYIKCFNATKAYQRAYQCSYETAASISYRMLENDGIKNEIKLLKQAKLNKAMLEPEDIFEKYMKIAFADITDYVSFGREEVPVMGAFGPIKIEDEETGEKIQIKKEINVVKFKESIQVDGTIITEVKQGKDGASFKLKDGMKALDWLTDHMDLATDEQKLRIEKLKSDIDKNKPVNEDDGLGATIAAAYAKRKEQEASGNE